MSSATPDDLQPAQPERSLGDLVGEMAHDLSTLVRQEVELAKVEITEEVDKARSAATAFTGAVVVGLYAGFALVLAVGLLLAEAVASWIAFLLVAIVLGAVAAVLALRGRQQLTSLDPVPEQTIETMKENAQWLSEQRS